MIYDLIVIGAGPAGMTAAMYACRAGLKTMIVEKMFPGGQAATTYEIDNYPGFETGVSGPELMDKFRTQAMRFGAELVSSEVTALDLSGEIKKVKTVPAEYSARGVILAMGAQPRELGLPNERALRGSGVSYCATCDGAFFRNKTIAIVGGGNTAVEDALFLATLCEKVYLIHRRDSLRADKTYVNKILENPKISILWDTVVDSLNAPNGFVESLTIKNVRTAESKDIDISGLFVAVGVVPDTQLVQGIVPMDENGFVITDEHMRTPIPGVYAVGDLRVTPLRQVLTAAADGAIGAYSAAQNLI